MFFANISYLLLFIPLIGYVVWYLIKGKSMKPAMKVSTIAPFGRNIKSFRNRILHLPFALRVLTLSMVIIVLARPQSSDSWEESDIEGIDIMLATDVCLKSLLHKFGGWSYDHVFTNIIPMMENEGISKEDIDTIINKNPTEFICSR